VRLSFNVLWVDDQPDRVAAQIRGIASRMEEEGFEFKPRQCQSMDEVQALIASDIFTDEVDLILVDWDLGGGLEGQQVIAEIRESIQYKDVVFYSAMTAADRLREFAFNAGLEGIYCANRTDLVDEVMGVFESLVKKVLDLDHTRGIVMGATSDIDGMVNTCLASIHGKLEEAGRQEMLADVLGLLDEGLKDHTKRVNKLKGSTSMAALFEAHRIFTANDRLRILSRLLDKEDFKAHSDVKPSLAVYIKEVVPRRNDLGHLVLVPEGKPQALVDNQGKSISLAEMRKLRRLILNLRNDFRTLLIALQGNS
jgi:hypothetical protein